jgi:hypothetical protein
MSLSAIRQPLTPECGEAYLKNEEKQTQEEEREKDCGLHPAGLKASCSLAQHQNVVMASLRKSDADSSGWLGITG